MTYRFAVFDCDGTLVDGQAGICRAMEAAFAAAGQIAPDRPEIRQVVGLSLPQGVAVLNPHLSPDIRAEIVENYKQAYRAQRESGELEEPLFEGMLPLLTNLRGAGWTLGIATGKSRRGLNHCLDSLGIAELFSTLQTADDHPSKPDPAMLASAMSEVAATPAETVMIGDTSYDIEMALAATVRPIGVSWGYHNNDELYGAGAESVAKTPAALEQMLL